MKNKTLLLFAYPLCLIFVFVSTGCSRAPGKSKFSVAHDAMQQTLDYWKAGKSPADIKSESKLIVGDTRWEKGLKLLDFQVDDSPKDDGRNYHFKNRLSVMGENGEVTQEQSMFIVATDPVVTVFREDSEAE
jgi:hypothetical protein